MVDNSIYVLNDTFQQQALFNCVENIQPNQSGTNLDVEATLLFAQFSSILFVFR